MRFLTISIFSFLFISCFQKEEVKGGADSIVASETLIDTTPKTIVEVNKPEPYNYSAKEHVINTGSTSPSELLAFANTLVGTPYKYGSTDPANGFDCSGFITHVFNHFNIAVPRSSIDFTNVQTEIPLEQAKPGDLVLFTGTDSTATHVGHMGIITTADNNSYKFIHSTSGKSYGVTETELNKYYMKRFVKIVRVFKQNY